MSLQALPPELLARIIYFTQPSGFENFLLTSRGVHACGRPYIAAHSRRKKLWGCICVGKPCVQEAYQSTVKSNTILALDFVYVVAVIDPPVPGYVKHISFHNDGKELESEDEDDYNMDKSDVEDDAALREMGGGVAWWNDDTAMRAMRDLVTGSLYLRTAGVDVDDWAAKMFDADQEGRPSYKYRMHILVFILTLLDNVRELDMNGWPWMKRHTLIDPLGDAAVAAPTDGGDDSRNNDDQNNSSTGDYDMGGNEDTKLENAEENDPTEYPKKHQREHPEIVQVLYYLVRNANENNDCRDGRAVSAALCALECVRLYKPLPPIFPNVPLRCYAWFIALRSLKEFYAERVLASEPDSFPPRLLLSPSWTKASAPAPSLIPNPASNLYYLSLESSNVSLASLKNFLRHAGFPRLQSFKYAYRSVK